MSRSMTATSVPGWTLSSLIVVRRPPALFADDDSEVAKDGGIGVFAGRAKSNCAVSGGTLPLKLASIVSTGGPGSARACTLPVPGADQILAGLAEISDEKSGSIGDAIEEPARFEQKLTPASPSSFPYELRFGVDRPSNASNSCHILLGSKSMRSAMLSSSNCGTGGS